MEGDVVRFQIIIIIITENIKLTVNIIILLISIKGWGPQSMSNFVQLW